jgi:nucleotide-binding universal stress UspA family protein
MQSSSEQKYVVAVGLDGSNSSWKAFAEAVQQAKQKRAGALHLVSIQESSDASYSASEVLATEMTAQEKLQSIQTKAAVEAEKEGLHVVAAIVAGNPCGALVDYVKHHKVDLLIVGDTGHSSIWGALLGTTSEKIVRQAPCSVLIVR